MTALVKFGTATLYGKPVDDAMARGSQIQAESLQRPNGQSSYLNEILRRTR
jgi:hypothetical protein